MKYFVKQNSIVRDIWSKADTILFIFAGSAAEFALNKAVDWLYFTGKLPADPLARLFSTVAYAKEIIFAEYSDAIEAIDRITLIHNSVEQSRGYQIPDWAYLDVLYMLIDYSVRSYELLETELSTSQKEEVYDVFYRVGERMGISSLPLTYSDWQTQREKQLQENLKYSELTKDLYVQYKKHLGLGRYLLLKQVQIILVPDIVSEKLKLGNIPFLNPLLQLYKFFRILRLNHSFRNLLLPPTYKLQIINLDK